MASKKAHPKGMKKENAIVPPDFAEPLLDALVDFLLSSGLSKRQISRVLEMRLRKADSSRKSQHLQGLDRAKSSAVGAVFHIWFREPAWISNLGKPKPLRLLGPRNSVQALLQKEMPKGLAERTARELVGLKLVRKTGNGRYLPAGLHGVFRENHPYLQEHVALSIVRFLHTARENLSSGRTSPPMFERFAHVAAIPADTLNEFRDFANQQGEAIIDTINDWLEARRVRSADARGIRTVQAGLHVFAFAAPNSVKS